MSFYLLGEFVPNFQAFEAIPFFFISLFIMVLPLLLVRILITLIFALLEAASPGFTDIFKVDIFKSKR